MQLIRSALLGAACALALGGAPALAQADADLAAEVAALSQRLQRVEDELAIQKLQARYSHMLLTQDFDRVVAELFPKSIDDVTVEFSDSGVYRGLESVRALYAAFEVTKTQPGFFIMHTTVDPVIEIAPDGMTARSHWLSPGATGGEHRASWVWGLYYADYVKEDGAWKIQHTALVPIFRNPYGVSWAEAESHGTVRGILSVEPDGPSTLYRPYNEIKSETEIFSRLPELPAAE